MIDPKENPLNLRDREPEQGEQFSEPKAGGLYPFAGIAAAAVILVALVAYFAM